MKVGIQGVPGSFCEVAARAYFQTEKVEYVYLVNSYNVCEALSHKTIDRGVIAVENSIGGKVVESEVALSMFSMRVMDEIVIPIQQCLMSNAPVMLHEVSEIHSHPQALAQSTLFIEVNMPRAKIIPEEDTAICAQFLRDGKWPETAAMIGSATCADIYGLYLLQANVQNTDDNETRFVILAAE